MFFVSPAKNEYIAPGPRGAIFPVMFIRLAKSMCLLRFVSEITPGCTDTATTGAFFAVNMACNCFVKRILASLEEP